MARWQYRAAVAVALLAALVAACSAHLVSSVRVALHCVAPHVRLLTLVAPSHQPLGSEGRMSRHATSAVLALVSGALADPKPVKDAQQAAELAHILKTVRVHGNWAVELMPLLARSRCRRGARQLCGGVLSLATSLRCWAH